MKLPVIVLTCLIASLAACAQSFSVTYSKDVSAQPLDGRLLLVLSTDASDAEPRNQIDDTPRSQIVFGINVDGWQAGKPAVVDAGAWGYPVHSLKDVPPGDYFVQAVLNKYETFHRSDRKTVKMHMDAGEGQHWNSSPGNLYSKAKKITVKAGGTPIAITLDQVIPPIETPAEIEVCPAHQDPERCVDEVLGTADVREGGRAGAGRVRRACRCTLSTDDLSRSLRLRHRRLSHHAA